MRRRNLMIFVFLCLVFAFPLFAIGLEEPIESDTSYDINQAVPARDHICIEIIGGDKGSLIYWYMEFEWSLDFYIIDPLDLEDINDKIWDKEAVFNVTTKTEYDIVLPYDDTFYFVMFNRKYLSVAVDGWYARDETEPDGKMRGLNTNFASEVLLGSTRDVVCMFNDHFDIVNLIMYENDEMVRTFYGPSDDMVEWTITDYEFSNLGETEISFKAEDQGGNIGVISKTVKIVNKLSSKPTKPEYFDWVGIFEDYWFVMIPVGALLGIAVIVGLEKAGKLP